MSQAELWRRSANKGFLGLEEMPLPAGLADLMARLYPEPVLLLDKKEDKIIWASPGMMILSGCGGNELRKFSCREFLQKYFYPSDAVLDLLEKGASDGQFTSQFRSPAENKVVHGIWMRLSEGDAAGLFLLMLRDVTEIEILRQELLQYSEELQQQLEAVQRLSEEKERAYQKLREQSEKLRLISTATAYSNTMKFILEPDGTIVWVNRFFEKASGWSASELIGRNVRDIGGRFAHLLRSPEDVPSEETLIVNHFHRAPFTEEIYAYDRKGQGFWMLITVAPVPNEIGETTHYLGALINIHEKKQREEELRRYKEEIQQSLTYAARIHERFMPSIEGLRQYFQNAEVWYQPLIGIGGDFFQYEAIEGGVVLALGDCTGHGLPASLLSVYAATAIRFSISTYKNDIERIDHFLREDIQAVFGGEHPLYEGFELALLWYLPETMKATFMGAGRPLWVLRRGIIVPVIGGRSDISIMTSGASTGKSSALQRLSLQKGDRLYLFSDGVSDQLNSEGKRFSKTRLQNLLSTTGYLPLHEQMEMVRKAIQQWAAGAPQTDDLLLIALEV
ncbi:MAG: SpoIIE family protein phosphatase [Bacteroidia bacterium]|nr:SpoIIE family protein phosphatase [Bacteroidia bacterium]